jgi:hypothetical protein
MAKSPTAAKLSSEGFDRWEAGARMPEGAL